MQLTGITNKLSQRMYNLYTVPYTHYERLAEQLGERYRDWLNANRTPGKPLVVTASTQDAVAQFVNWAEREFDAHIVYDYGGDCIAAINLPSVEAAVRLYLLI